MTQNSFPINEATWKVEKIGVVGPGIVGMPMAALLASARIKIGTTAPARVVVIQRNSKNSGWKTQAINEGRSVIGGIEPGLDAITAQAVKDGILSASHDFEALSEADVILVSVQTDKKGFEPDYGPLFGALEGLALALKKKPPHKIPLLVFESTLAPTTMDTLIRNHFKKHGLEEGKDILLGNSPNRVMPGRLVERVSKSDKLAGGLHPQTPNLIEKLYNHIVTEGTLHKTNSLTAEIVKTLENAYRDVRIAFSAEIVRYCDKHDIDFFGLRDVINERMAQSDNASKDPNAVPSGGLLVPMLGVGGHCLPKDGILLWWRNIEAGKDTSNSLIINSRDINDASPVLTFRQAEKTFGSLKGKRIALLGVAYRFNSEDTRNSPTLTLANYLRDEGISYILHDPYVKPQDQNLLKYNQENFFTRDLGEALKGADVVIMCTAHKEYMDRMATIRNTPGLSGLMDACNIYPPAEFAEAPFAYTGIGRGRKPASEEFTRFVFESFRAMERGLARELLQLIEFYNKHFAFDEYNKVDFKVVQKLARTCGTGCEIADPEKVDDVPEYKGFKTRLAECASKL
ncbi:MAG: nucleotide sugar dehydrogenase [Bacteroidales bacterium]|jgi:UDP-N-acetyl-D-mannosaminuronic acid dehydrogenase|nr:nucleotide sugar dehydrogenase [Bacteroidales bacterium]NLM93418.1 nucleotide sugar dehydrogenase [Bacteroidales bacterium]